MLSPSQVLGLLVASFLHLFCLLWRLCLAFLFPSYSNILFAVFSFFNGLLWQIFGLRAMKGKLCGTLYMAFLPLIYVFLVRVLCPHRSLPPEPFTLILY